MITGDSVKRCNKAGLNGQTDDRSSYNIVQKTGIKEVKLCGTLKRILIWFHGGVQRGGDKSMSTIAVAIRKTKISTIYSHKRK